MKRVNQIVACLILAAGAPVIAQQQSWSPIPAGPPEQSDGVPLSKLEASRGPDWQPGNAEAKEYARIAGISIGEATSEMRRMAALKRFIERLQNRRPELFSFVAQRNGNLVIGLTDPSADLSDFLPKGLLDPTFVQAALSDTQAETILQKITGDLRSVGLDDVTVGVAPESGNVTFLAGDSTGELRSALQEGRLTVDQPYEILDDQVTVAATLVGSASWNVDTSYCSQYCGGTTGFSLMSTGSDATRYVTTAGHVHNGRSRYNSRWDSVYSTSGSVALGSTIDLLSSGIDIQLASPSDVATNPPGPYIWDGTAYVTIRNVIYPIGGILMCKFGRITGPDCGLTEDPVRKYSNSNFGATGLYLIKKPSNISKSDWNQRGDSGGPVYRGDYAAGWIHGFNETTGDLYYTSSKSFREAGRPYDFIVAP